MFGKKVEEDQTEADVKRVEAVQKVLLGKSGPNVLDKFVMQLSSKEVRQAIGRYVRGRITLPKETVEGQFWVTLMSDGSARVDYYATDGRIPDDFDAAKEWAKKNG